MNKLNEVIGYVRSNHEKLENNDNLIKQENAIRKYAEENGHDVLEVFVDKNESTKNFNRTGLQAMLKYIEINPQKVKMLVVSDISRLSRNAEEFLSLKDFLKFRGIKLTSLAR